MGWQNGSAVAENLSAIAAVSKVAVHAASLPCGFKTSASTFMHGVLAEFVRHIVAVSENGMTR